MTDRAPANSTQAGALFFKPPPPNHVKETMNRLQISRFPAEAWVWVLGLLFLALQDPHAAQHFTICPLANMGWDFCPGCGLGRSITLLFHGMPAASFKAHPLGFFAVAVLIHRIYSLTKTTLTYHGKNH